MSCCRAFALTLLALAWAMPPAHAASIANGRTLYSTWCAQCHAANPKQDSRGVLFGANYAPGIQLAIDGQVPDMKILQGIIMPADVDDIAAYLGSVVGPPPPGTGTLSLPTVLPFADQQVGTQSAPTQVTIVNSGTAAVAITSVTQNNLAEFPFTANTCVGTLAAGANCALGVAFHPAATGARGSTITLVSDGTGSPQSIVLSGTGTTAAPPPPVTTTAVVEYYWATRDHYFITASAAEIAALDAAQNGANTWVRTGQTFKALAVAADGSSAVCRFYLPVQYGDSHFYGRSPAECALTHATYPGFVYESPLVMYMYALTPLGNCTAGAIPVYRVFDQRADANHRYMTDRNLRNQMVAKGWVAEGDGVDLVVMCAPQ